MTPNIFCVWNDCNSYHPLIQLLLLIGTILAVVVCWSRTGSIFISVLAGIFGWLYLIAIAIKHWWKKDLKPASSFDK